VYSIEQPKGRANPGIREGAGAVTPFPSLPSPFPLYLSYPPRFEVGTLKPARVLIPPAENFEKKMQTT